MGYVGNTPTTIQGYFQGVESKSFNGNGSDQDFTLDRAVANTYDIEVVVNNVQQSPYDGSYSVSGTTLSFSEAPSTGSNNIYVTYRDTPQPTIAPTDGSVTTAKIADGAVTAAKIADGAAVPNQAGHAGQYLTTDGTTADWAALTQVQSDVHAFYVDSNGDLQWVHGTDVTALQDANNEDIYDLVIVGSDDQTYSLDASGQLVLTIS